MLPRDVTLRGPHEVEAAEADPHRELRAQIEAYWLETWGVPIGSTELARIAHPAALEQGRAHLALLRVGPEIADRLRELAGAMAAETERLIGEVEVPGAGLKLGEQLERWKRLAARAPEVAGPSDPEAMDELLGALYAWVPSPERLPNTADTGAFADAEARMRDRWNVDERVPPSGRAPDLAWGWVVHSLAEWLRPRGARQDFWEDVRLGLAWWGHDMRDGRETPMRDAANLRRTESGYLEKTRAPRSNLYRRSARARFPKIPTA